MRPTAHFAARIMAIRIAIIEDDPEMRRAFEEVVSAAGDLDLRGSHASVESFLARPEGLDGLDVVLTDIDLPGADGIQLIAQCKPQRPAIQFLVVTVFEDAGHLYDALCVGATGYLVKNAGPAAVAQAIRDVHAGGSPMSLSVARLLVERMQRERGGARLLAQLTKREHEVVLLLADGYRYKEIADRLGLSVLTVRSYIRDIYEKLHVQSRTEALNKLYGR